MTEFLLELRDVTKTYPGVTALDGVSLSVAPWRGHRPDRRERRGQVHPDEHSRGRVSAGRGNGDAGGKPVGVKNPRDQAAGIAIIFQELNLVPDLSIAENIFIGREPLNRGGSDRHAPERRRGEALLSGTRIGRRPRTLVANLKVGAQQVVEIARAISFNSRVIIMDEPTSSLTLTETDRLLNVISDLRAHGVSVIYISHRLGEVKSCADRVTVLRDGRHIGWMSRNEITHEAMIRLMIGRELENLYIRQGFDRSRRASR